MFRGGGGRSQGWKVGVGSKLERRISICAKQTRSSLGRATLRLTVQQPRPSTCYAPLVFPRPRLPQRILHLQVCTNRTVGSSAICRPGSRVLRRICTLVSAALDSMAYVVLWCSNLKLPQPSALEIFFSNEASANDNQSASRNLRSQYLIKPRLLLVANRSFEFLRTRVYLVHACPSNLSNGSPPVIAGRK